MTDEEYTAPLLLPYKGNQANYERIWNMWLQGYNRFTQYVIDNIIERPENISEHEIHIQLNLLKQKIQENRKPLKNYITNVLSHDTLQSFPEIADIVIEHISISKQEVEHIKNIVFYK